LLTKPVIGVGSIYDKSEPSTLKKKAYSSPGLVKAAGDGAGVAKLMTPDQIAEAQRLAREWKPTPTQ
jgi:hypothetical protein